VSLGSPGALGRLDASALAFDAVEPASQATVEPPVSTAPAFDPAELGRGLRRGAEVDRFNELASRQDSLTPAESDELYQYRLRRLLMRARQLERAASSADENSLRDALDDFRGRLQDLRAFESGRRGAGLWAEYEVDRTAEEQAVTRLLTLAAQRPHGLIAGSEEAAERPSGSIRIREARFALLRQMMSRSTCWRRPRSPRSRWRSMSRRRPRRGPAFVSFAIRAKSRTQMLHP